MKLTYLYFGIILFALGLGLDGFTFVLYPKFLTPIMIVYIFINQ